MKTIFLVIISCFLFSQLNAQTVEAHYLIKQPNQLDIGNDKTKEIILEYEGLVYQSGAKAISYMVPQYLMEYPKGEISISTESGFTIVPLNMDSLQLLHLYNMDSLRLWFYYGSNGKVQQSFTRKFKPGVLQWKILPEIKMINGLQCQHARMYAGSDTTTFIHDIWYYPGVSMGFGLIGIRDAPGLIVECSSPLAHMSYSLKYFKIGEPVNDSVFWPAIFKNVKFEDMSPVKKPANADKKSSIMSQ